MRIINVERSFTECQRLLIDSIINTIIDCSDIAMNSTEYMLVTSTFIFKPDRYNRDLIALIKRFT